VKTLVASLQHFYNSEGQWKPLLLAYTIFTTVKTLAASLRHFYNSEGQWKPLLPAYTILHGLLPISFLCRQPTPFYISEGHLTLAASLHHFTRFIARLYLDLSVRLKKVHDFLSFSHWKLRVFLRFSHGFLPTASRTYANNVHRNLPQSAHETAFCNRQIAVYWPLYGVIIPDIYGNWVIILTWRGG
jgi:hypothetical protein